MSLIASSNSLNLRFYESSKESDIEESKFAVDLSNEPDSSAIDEELLGNKEDSFERDAEEIKEEKKKKSRKDSVNYAPPIKKGYFIRKKELEGTIGRGNTLGGIQSTEIQVLQFLGSGGEGKVFLGRITDLDQLVAFKQFEIVENDEQERKIMEAIKKEMKIVKNLSHKNVVKFYTIHKSNIDGDNAVQYNILMEYLEGGSLDTLLAKHKRPMKLPLVKSIIKQIL